MKALIVRKAVIAAIKSPMVRSYIVNAIMVHMKRKGRTQNEIDDAVMVIENLFDFIGGAKSVPANPDVE